MGFLNPIALVIGGGLLALPIAVHLLTRPRPVRYPFSALRFLDSVLRQRRFFSRLRDVLILALRGLLLVAVAGWEELADCPVQQAHVVLVLARLGEDVTAAQQRIVIVQRTTAPAAGDLLGGFAYEDDGNGRGHRGRGLEIEN